MGGSCSWDGASLLKWSAEPCSRRLGYCCQCFDKRKFPQLEARELFRGGSLVSLHFKVIFSRCHRFANAAANYLDNCGIDQAPIMVLYSTLAHMQLCMGEGEFLGMQWQFSVARWFQCMLLF